MTVVFFPEGAFGPDEQLRRDRATCCGSAAQRVVFVVEESFAGTLEAQGFEERADAAQAAARGRGGARPVLEGLRPRHGARCSASRRSSSSETFILPVWQELVDGARYVDERLAEIFDELEPDVIVEDNVVAFPAVLASGGLGADRLLQPARAEGPGAAAAVLRLPDRRPGRLGGVPRASTAELHEPLQREFSAFCEERGAPPLPELEFMHESPFLNLYLYPGRGRLPRGRVPLGADLAATSSRACARSTSRSSCRPRATGALVYLSLGSLGSADVELMQPPGRCRWPTTPHRVSWSQGPAARPSRAGAEHDRRRVPAAARDPAAGRPRDHPRRQQHRHRVDPLRQADDRAAALLGPVRQRPARRRDRLRRAAARPTSSRTRSCTARSTGWSRRRTSAAGGGVTGGSGRSPARFAPPT